MPFHLTQHPFRVEIRVPALAMLIPGHYSKRLKPISYPYATKGDKSASKVAVKRQSDIRKIEYSPTEPKAGAGPGLGMSVKDLARKTISAEAG